MKRRTKAKKRRLTIKPFRNPITKKLSTSTGEALENLLLTYKPLYTPNPNPSSLREENLVMNATRATSQIKGDPTTCDPITVEEYSRAIKGLRSGAAPGADNILPSFLKDAAEAADTSPISNYIYSLLRDSFETEFELTPLKTLIIFPIVKDRKGDLHDGLNHRPIALLSTLFKLYESILLNRITRTIEPGDTAVARLPEEGLPDCTFGFRPRRSTTHSITTLRETIVDAYSQTPSKPVYAAFLDISKAFDFPICNSLWNKLWNMDVRNKL